MVKASDIIAMVKTTKDDHEIAKRLDCSVFTVRDFRRTMKRAKNINRINPVRPPSTPNVRAKDQTNITETDRVISNRFEKASRNLIIRQLETGQHWLGKDDFLKLVHNLKLNHLLPPKFQSL
jgi:hypothetical protein